MGDEFMSRLLEILGRAISVDTADLIWHWLDTIKQNDTEAQSAQYQQLNHISELISDKRIESAAEQLRLYLFENPSCTRGRLAAAAVCLHKNQIQNAIEELNSVYMRQPSNTMALYALGHCYERLEKESEAIEFYQDCLKFKNYLQLPRQRLAAIYFKNGQLEKTIEEYQLLREEYPEDMSMLMTLGYLYIAAAEYNRAIDALNKAILLHPDNFGVVDDYLDRLIRDGRIHEALQEIDAILQNQPNEPHLIAKRADLLGMMGDNVESIQQFEEALRICPGSLETTIKLGTQYMRNSEFLLAAEQFNRAVEINDQIVDAYIGLSIAQKSMGNTSEALATLSLAAAVDPNSSLLFTETAMLHFRIHYEDTYSSVCVDDTASFIENVISAHRRQLINRPHNPDLHYRIGILMMNFGRHKDAIKSFKLALEINPTFNRARNKLAICLFETDRKQDALQQLNDANVLNRDTIDLHYKTALLFCNRLKFASSLLNLQHSMENSFATSDTTVNISIVLQNLGLLDRSSMMWENLSDTAFQAMDRDNSFPTE
jgi:tetratricopeptide (TPR) repeat protein